MTDGRSVRRRLTKLVRQQLWQRHSTTRRKVAKHVVDDDDDDDDDDCVRSLRPAAGVRARGVDAGRGDEDAKLSPGGGVECSFSERFFRVDGDDDDARTRTDAMERKVHANVGNA
jgi:hypothetical protein